MDINEAVNVEEKTLENESVLKETLKAVWKIVLFILSIMKRICDIFLWICRPIISLIMLFSIVALFFTTVDLFMTYNDPSFNLWDSLSLILFSLALLVISALLYKE